jgi:hypothetical protein
MLTSWNCVKRTYVCSCLASDNFNWIRSIPGTVLDTVSMVFFLLILLPCAIMFNCSMMCGREQERGGGGGMKIGGE